MSGGNDGAIVPQDLHHYLRHEPHNFSSAPPLAYNLATPPP